MKTYRIDGKKVKVPTSWDDVSFRKYMKILRLRPDSTDNEFLGIMLDITIDRTTEFENLDQVLKDLNFARFPKAMPASPTRLGTFIFPQTIIWTRGNVWQRIKSKFTKLPVFEVGAVDLPLESIGQFEDMRKVMTQYNPADELTDQERVAFATEAYPKYAAIYCQKMRDKVYDYEKAMKLSEEFWDCSSTEVITVGNFFFTKLLNSFNYTPTTARRAQSA
jgi:hypothetical protein